MCVEFRLEQRKETFGEALATPKRRVPWHDTRRFAARLRGTSRPLPHPIQVPDTREHSPSEDWLTAERLEILAETVKAFEADRLERGRLYATDERVGTLRLATNEIQASVDGNRTYDVSWRWAEAAWTPSCTCPVAPRCKHAFALACVALVNGLPIDRLELSWIGNLLPERLVRRRLDRARSPQEREPEQQSPDADRTPPASRELAALEQLRTCSDWLDRVSALADLLRADRRLAYAAFQSPLSDLVELEDPDIRCFVIARELVSRMGTRLPVTLAPFLERPDLEQRYRSQMEDVLAVDDAPWVGEPHAPATRRLRMQFRLEGDPLGDVVVKVQTRVTSERLTDVLRTGLQLRQLLARADQESGVLSDDQHELLSMLLESTVSPFVNQQDPECVLSGEALLRVLFAVAGTQLATWSDQLPAQLAGLADITPGEPLKLASGTVDIEPVLCDVSGHPRVVLEHRIPEGAVLTSGERLLLRARPGAYREPTLLLTSGQFWTTRGAHPAISPELFASPDGFDPSQNPALLEPLARAFPAFRASLAPYTRVHPAHPTVCLDLRSDDWLQIRAFASAIPGWRSGDAVSTDAMHFEWTGARGWVPCIESTAKSTAPGADPIWLELPDPDRVAPIVSWLESLDATNGSMPQAEGEQPLADDREFGTWMRLTPSTIDKLADAWALRPADVTWFGSDALLKLFTAPEPMVPQLRVASSGVDWFMLSAEWEAESAALTDAEFALLRNSTSRFVRLPSGWARSDVAHARSAADEALAELGIEADGEAQRVSVWQLARARPDALAAILGTDLDAGAAGSVSALDDVRTLREKVAAFTGLPRVDLPPGIEGSLRPYQRTGLDFLSHAASLGLGAILADDMGLGKTVQALVWLARLVSLQPEGGPSLVVCPASVLHNWEREAERFTPRLRVLALTAGSERHALREQIPAHDLVVTNYALLRRDREELGAISWRAVILDEAQNIKNPDTAVSRAARALRAQHKLALTGTPLENRALDLWSIQAFLNPGYLDNRTVFSQRYDSADAPPHARTLLAARLRPVMLRRLKSEVAPELPPRIEKQRECELTPGQRKLYLAELSKARAFMGGLETSGGVTRNKISILAVLTRLRQICCHPALVNGPAELGSGKFTALFELLEPLLAEGHKVLVFSQFVECLKLVATDMRSRGIAYHMLTGSSRKRGEIVEAFENDPDPAVFLISLKAGGTGLNLTAANYVVLFDPWWNPAVEAQAIDRTHRIGQDQTVIAYRLVALGTIEERIRELQARKATLARDVLGEGGFAKALTRNDLDFLFSVD